MISAADPVFESGTVESMDLVTRQAALFARNLTSAFLVSEGGGTRHDQPRLGADRRWWPASTGP